MQVKWKQAKSQHSTSLLVGASFKAKLSLAGANRVDGKQSFVWTVCAWLGVDSGNKQERQHWREDVLNCHHAAHGVSKKLGCGPVSNT